MVEQWRDRIRWAALETLSGPACGIYLGIIIGEQGYIAQEVRDAFMATGRPCTSFQFRARISDSITVSFDGTSPVRGGPVNAPEHAIRSVVRAAIKGVLSPIEPSNEGDFRPIEFNIPKGLVVSPERPAPVDSYGYVCIACYELTMRALTQAVPARCIAGGATLCMPTISRVNPRDGRPFILSDPFDVGNGARPDADAPTMSINVMGDVPNSPVEVVEMRYPIRMERFGFRPESAGHGKFRGGAGVYRDYRVLEDGITLYSAIENTRDTVAKGVDGGLLQAFQLINEYIHFFPADEVPEYYYTVLVEKIQLLRGYSISQLKMTIPFFHSYAVTVSILV